MSHSPLADSALEIIQDITKAMLTDKVTKEYAAEIIEVQAENLHYLLQEAYKRGRNDAAEEIRLMQSQAMHLHGNCVDQRAAAMKARFGGDDQ